MPRRKHLRQALSANHHSKYSSVKQATTQENKDMTSTTQNTPATIESTVEASLRSAGYSTYLRQARPVVEALVEREQAIAEKILDYAGEQGASTDEVTELLTSLGVSLKPEEPVVEETDTTGGDNNRIASALERIEQRLDSLTAFARNNGYRG